MQALKIEFLKSINPYNFIIRPRGWPSADIAPFGLKNNLTGEPLELRRFEEGNWLLDRCPIEGNEKKWAEWEAEANYCHWNRVRIDFQDSDIDDNFKVGYISDGLLDTNEGPENE